jgi:hypothetical protein
LSLTHFPRTLPLFFPQFILPDFANSTFSECTPLSLKALF